MSSRAPTHSEPSPEVHQSRLVGDRSGSCRAFTLPELLLVVALLMLFTGAAVLSLAPLWRGAPLEEGVGRLEGLLRFARAEAAQQGRRVRLHVSPAAALTKPGTAEGTAVEVEWEPEPLRQPGVFVPSQTTAAMAQSLTELVRIESIRRLDPDGAPDSEGASTNREQSALTADAETTSAGASAASGATGVELTATDSAEAWPPITFYPDGSSDSAEILLAGLDASDTRRMVVRWNGLSGTASRCAASSDRAAETDAAGAGAAQPLEPSSVEHTAMGPVAP